MDIFTQKEPWKVIELVRVLTVFIVEGFRTIVFIFVVISTTFRSSSGVCSDSVSHNWVQVLSTPVLLLACSQDWTGNLQMIVSLEV